MRQTCDLVSPRTNGPWHNLQSTSLSLGKHEVRAVTGTESHRNAMNFCNFYCPEVKPVATLGKAPKLPPSMLDQGRKNRWITHSNLVHIWHSAKISMRSQFAHQPKIWRCRSLSWRLEHGGLSCSTAGRSRTSTSSMHSWNPLRPRTGWMRWRKWRPLR